MSNAVTVPADKLAELQRENREMRGALEAALPVLQDYASSNPMHFYRGAWQDPRGVHAAVKLVTAALGVMAAETRLEPRMAFCPACFVQVSATEADQQTLDARRYRLLRSCRGQEHDPLLSVQHETDGLLWGANLDAAVDSALGVPGPDGSKR